MSIERSKIRRGFKKVESYMAAARAKLCALQKGMESVDLKE